MTERTGGCACGAVRFKITAPFIAVGACHCTDCQKASGGGPNYVGLVPPAAFEVTKGEAKSFGGKGDSGAVVARTFCAECGTPLWSGGANEGFIPVKLGALDDHSDLAPQLHIYASSAAPWHRMDDGLPAFAKCRRRRRRAPPSVSRHLSPHRDITRPGGVRPSRRGAIPAPARRRQFSRHAAPAIAAVSSVGG